jgi:hypothetical protein
MRGGDRDGDLGLVGLGWGVLVGVEVGWVGMRIPFHKAMD